MTITVDWSKAPEWARAAVGIAADHVSWNAYWVDKLPRRVHDEVDFSDCTHTAMDAASVTFGATGVPAYWQIPRKENDWTPAVEPAGDPYCSFCGDTKSHLDATQITLVIGTDVTICEACIAFAQTQVDAKKDPVVGFEDFKNIVGYTGVVGVPVDYLTPDYPGLAIDLAVLHGTEVAPEAYTFNIAGYEMLARVLVKAYEQAAVGKGRERHANDLPFDEQPMQRISTLLDNENGMSFQAMKKIQEGLKLPHDAKIKELLGAIVYIAGMVIWLEKNKCSTTPTATKPNNG